MDKNLRNCKLSNEEIISIWTEIPFEENSFDYEEELLKAQLEKCRVYIEEHGKEKFAQGLDEFLDTEKERERLAVKVERERIYSLMRTDMDKLTEEFLEWQDIKLKEEVNVDTDIAMRRLQEEGFAAFRQVAGISLRPDMPQEEIDEMEEEREEKRRR